LEITLVLVCDSIFFYCLWLVHSGVWLLFGFSCMRCLRTRLCNFYMVEWGFPFCLIEVVKACYLLIDVKLFIRTVYYTTQLFCCLKFCIFSFLRCSVCLISQWVCQNHSGVSLTNPSCYQTCIQMITRVLFLGCMFTDHRAWNCNLPILLDFYDLIQKNPNLKSWKTPFQCSSSYFHFITSFENKNVKWTHTVDRNIVSLCVF